MEKMFGRFARTVSNAIGSPFAFALAVLVVVMWALSGPFLGFSSTWQLIINTLTTITTGLIVFIIQYAQNKDTKAIHIKLDEILIALNETNEDVAELENKDAEDIEKVQAQHRIQLVNDRK